MEEAKNHGYAIHDDGTEVNIRADTSGNLDDVYALGYKHGQRDAVLKEEFEQSL